MPCHCASRCRSFASDSSWHSLLPTTFPSFVLSLVDEIAETDGFRTSLDGEAGTAIDAKARTALQSLLDDYASQLCALRDR